jgi:TetR/AcrR family transcriptional regulator, cholesterol catabolism regulator
VAKKSIVRDAAPDDAISKSARTRRRILDAAAHVLSVKGYAGTRLSDVAEYAELQAPAIYYYFPSRDDLIEEVMYAGIAAMREHLTSTLDALPQHTSPMDRILAAVEAHLRHELELSDYASALIRNAGQIPDRLRARQLKEDAAYGRIWRRLFDDARAKGQLRSDLDARLAQLLVIGALNWSAEWFDPRRSSVDAIVSNAQALVRNGLSPVRKSNSGLTKRTPRRDLGQVK